MAGDAVEWHVAAVTVKGAEGVGGEGADVGGVVGEAAGAVGVAEPAGEGDGAGLGVEGADDSQSAVVCVIEEHALVRRGYVFLDEGMGLEGKLEGIMEQQEKKMVTDSVRSDF